MSIPKIHSDTVTCTKRYATSVFLSFIQKNFVFVVLANNDYEAIMACLKSIAQYTVSQNPEKRKEVIESFKQESCYIRSRSRDYANLVSNLRMMGYHVAQPVVIEESSKPLGTNKIYYMR